MAHHCPICHQLRPRKDYATCGAVDCVATWKPLTATQRERMKNGEEAPTITPTLTPTLERILSSSIENADKVLESIFGKKGGD